MSKNIWRCRCGKRAEVLTDENFGDCGCSDPVYGPEYFYMSKECADMLDEMDKDYDEQHKQLVEAQADADHWKSECNALQRMVHDARAEIDGLTLMATNASMEPARRLIQKNKELHAVIEQMREALRLALSEARSTHCEQTILAALAAERGEK